MVSHAESGKLSLHENNNKILKINSVIDVVSGVKKKESQQIKLGKKKIALSAYAYLIHIFTKIQLCRSDPNSYALKKPNTYT